LRPPQPPSILPEVWDLMRKCWAKEPNQRPEFETISQQLEGILLG